MPLSISEQRALALIPKFSACLSFVCSSTIAAMVLKKKNGKQKTYHRLVLGTSFADLCSSCAYFLSTWPIPRETGIVWAVGNTRTCAAQGFFLQAGIASPLYNVSLSIYFLAAVEQGRGESKLRRIEPFFHILPLLWGYGSAMAGLGLKIFNSANLWCWIADYPGRNENANVYRWALFYGPLWLGVLSVTFNLVRLFLYVRRLAKQSKENARSSSCDLPVEGEPGESSNLGEHDDDDDDDDDGGHEDLGLSSRPEFSPQRLEEECRSVDGVRKEGSSPYNSAETQRSSAIPGSVQAGKTAQILADRRNMLVWQCLRYAMAFYATWLPITILRIFQGVGKPIPFVLLLFASSCTPLQGLPNFLAYLYPRLVKGAKRFRLLGCLGILNVRNKHSSPPSSETRRQQHRSQGGKRPSEAFYEAYAKARNSFRNVPASGRNVFPKVAPRVMIRPDGALADRSGSQHGCGAVLDRALASVNTV
jgi:hypothetical protein